MRRTVKTAAIIATTLVAATACTDATDPSEDRASIDAKAYYDEYDEGSDEGGLSLGTAESGDSAADGAAPDGGATAPRSSQNSDKIVPCDDCEPPPHRIPPIDGANTFKNAGTNPFVDVTEQPASTFGLDVDDGSYRVAQHMLDRGVLPPKASVRAEEWINAFNYGDDAPTDADLGVAAETAATPDSRTQLLRVAVGARELEDSDRPPASLTFVVDTSGSMDIRERLGLVKSSLALLTKNLRPDDKIAIVTYDQQARGVLKPTPVSQSETILNAVDDLKPSGGTNLEAGVKLGYKYAKRASDDAGINSVILASDGVANIGLTNPDELASKVRTAATDDDIHLVTVGYGMGNYNDDLMEQLADQGQGFYSYVSEFDDAKQLFAEDLTSTLAVVANDAKAQVKFDPKTVQAYRLIGYENRAMTTKEFNSADADAGEIGSGMDVTALYEVTPSGQARSGAEIGTATVRWKSASDGAPNEATTDVRMPGVSATPSPSLQLAITVAEFADTIKNHQGDKAFDDELRGLKKTADELASDDVDGASELSTMIGKAIEAHPTGGPIEIQ